MKICEAYCNEFGTGYGGAPGDQTGRELRERDYYDRADLWDYCLVPVEKRHAVKAVELIRSIIKSRRCGYDRDKRTSLYKALKAASWNVGAMAKCSCDCSSLVSTCYAVAGVPDLSYACTTKNMVQKFVETGYFIKRPGKKEYACLGAVFVKVGSHALMVVEVDEETIAPMQPETSAERDYIGTLKVKGQSVHVRSGPGINYSELKPTLHKGAVERVYEKDPASGWYRIGEGRWITGKERYVEFINA